jgi:hypothetical protein
MAVFFGFTRNLALICCSVFYQAWLWQVKKTVYKNYYWTVCQYNGAWHGTQLGESLMVTNMYLLQ